LAVPNRILVAEYNGNNTQVTEVKTNVAIEMLIRL